MNMFVEFTEKRKMENGIEPGKSWTPTLSENKMEFEQVYGIQNGGIYSNSENHKLRNLASFGIKVRNKS